MDLFLRVVHSYLTEYDNKLLALYRTSSLFLALCAEFPAWQRIDPDSDVLCNIGIRERKSLTPKSRDILWIYGHNNAPETANGSQSQITTLFRFRLQKF